MTFQFYGYTLRSTTEADALLAFAWTGRWNQRGGGGMAKEDGYRFWLKQGEGRESFLVTRNTEPLAFVQTEHLPGNVVRLHWQPSPVASPKKLLRGITRLVPLMEAGLSLSGVRAIFLTSHSLTMVAFMEKLGYRLQPNVDGGADGVVMAKELNGAEARMSAVAAPQEQNRANQEQSLERGSQ
jgi:hypothetical protein